MSGSTRPSPISARPWNGRRPQAPTGSAGGGRTRVRKTSAMCSSWPRTTSLPCPVLPGHDHGLGRALEAGRLHQGLQLADLRRGKFSTSQNGVCSWTRHWNSSGRLLALVAALARARSGDSDFTWESLRDGVNKDLADVLGNFVNRTASFTASRYDGRLPEERKRPAGGRTRGRNPRPACGPMSPRWRPSNSAAPPPNCGRSGRRQRYLHRAEPWAQIKTDPGRAATALRMAFQSHPPAGHRQHPLPARNLRPHPRRTAPPGCNHRGLAGDVAGALETLPPPCHRAASTALHQDHRR